MSKEINYSYNSGDCVNNLLILKRYFKDGKRTYEYKCLNDGYIGETKEEHLKKGKGCPCCSTPCRLVVKGINDIATTHPYLVDYFVNKDEAFLYSYGSSKKLAFCCPLCGEEQVKKISYIARYGFSCNKCGDGVSRPEKIMSFVLDSLGIKYIKEYKDYWSENKRYDFYLTEKNTIIETHGRQHYFQRLDANRTLEEEQENDRFKEQIARENGIDNYVVLDCRYSDIDWIRKQINTHEFFNQFNLFNIDWVECEKFCLGNYNIEYICNLWSNYKSVGKIMEITNLGRTTILRFLKNGKDLGICDYEAKSSKHISSSLNGKANGKKVFCKEYNIQANGCGDMEEKLLQITGELYDRRSISRASKYNRTYKGLNFYYLEEA